MTILRYSIIDQDGTKRGYCDDTTQPFYVPLDKRQLFRGVNASGYLPPLEDAPLKETHTPEPEWTRRDIVQQLRADNENLRKHWYEHLKEDREYRANAKKKSNRYKYK